MHLEELNSSRSTLPQTQSLVCWTQHHWSAGGHWLTEDPWQVLPQPQNPSLHDDVGSLSCSSTSWTGQQRSQSLLGAQSQVLQKPFWISSMPNESPHACFSSEYPDQQAIAMQKSYRILKESLARSSVASLPNQHRPFDRIGWKPHFLEIQLAVHRARLRKTKVKLTVVGAQWIAQVHLRRKPHHL